MGPGPFWIENRKWKTIKKLKYLMIIGFQKKKMDRGVGGSRELYPNVIWIFGFFYCVIFNSSRFWLVHNYWGRKHVE